MENISTNDLEAIIGLTAIALPDEIIFSNEVQKIFLNFFNKSNNIAFTFNYLIQNPDLFEQRNFRNILSQKGLLELYKNELFNFIKKAESHILEIKSLMIAEEIKLNFELSHLTHPIYLTNLDLRKMCKYCKIKFAEKDSTNIPTKIIETSYYLTSAIYFASSCKSPKFSKKIRSYYESFGLNPIQMKTYLEKAEIDFKIIERNISEEFTNFEKKHILLMALKIAAIDLENSNSNAFKALKKYKDQFFADHSEILAFKKYHYFTDSKYLKHYSNFNDEIMINFLAFFISCLKVDQKIEKSEKELYVSLLRKLSFELNENSKTLIAKKTAKFQTKEENFIDTYRQLSLDEKFFIILTSLEILGADRVIEHSEENYILTLLEEIESSPCDEITLKTSFLLYIQFVIRNFETTINTHLITDLEHFLLKKAPPNLNIGLMIMSVIFTLNQNTTYPPLLLSKFKKLFLYNSNLTNQNSIVKEFENNFKEEFKSVKQNPILDYNSEIFLRLILSPEKCLELENFKECLINLTAAHIELTIDHQEMSQSFKNLIDHFSFELKIKNSNLEIRKKAVEIACELALADEKISTEELEIINKFTMELFLDEKVAFELSTRIMTYSDMKKPLHDYLDYKEYKPN